MAQPFQIAVPDATLTDLTRGLAATRLPQPLYLQDAAAGMQPEYLSALIDYWREDYDWRDTESELNRLHHFLTDIDDTRVHFIRERGAGPRPLPLLLLHGYPDSFYRFADAQWTPAAIQAAINTNAQRVEPPKARDRRLYPLSHRRDWR